jgi:hypothetical protein
MTPIGANRVTLVFIESLPHHFRPKAKRFAWQSIEAKFFELSFSHFAQQGFHVIEILFQRATPGRCQTVFSFGRAALERFRAIYVTGVFQFPRMDTQISIGCFDGMLQLIEGERFVCRQGADYAQPEALVNHPIDLVRAVGRAAMYASQLFFLILIFRYFAPQRCLFSHRTSSR